MAGRSSSARRVAVALAWRPEWPAAVAAAMAWVALAVIHASPAIHAAGAAHGSHRAAATPTLRAAVGGWALMSMAMMVPATLPAVRHVGLNSIRRRRRWAMAVYVTSYVAVWVVFGVLALLLVRVAMAAGLDERQLVPGALAIAAIWQLTRWKRRALVACQRTVPLPPMGRRADAACVRFGLLQARRCVVSCWPLMLLMAVVGHRSLVIMATLTAVITLEKRTSAATRERLIAPIAGALAAATVVLLA
ncbi:MAG: DUF2182 domain-containing protein [Egibacteraceae bacterium]